MLLKKLKQFHEQTMEQYRDEENIEPWKKTVMEIHEKSTFLFYYDATLEENIPQNTLRMQGSLVEGELPPGSTLHFYTGDGKYTGSGTILTEPEEKEQGRKGLLKRRRNEFEIRIDQYLGKKTEEMNQSEKRKMMRHFENNVSLIADLPQARLAHQKRENSLYL